MAQKSINNAADIITKKIASVLLFLALFYVLPLIRKPELLLNGQVIFLAFICTILFLTQPRLSFSESKKQFHTDKNTIWLIMLVSGLGQIVSLVEWAYFAEKSSILLTETISYQLPLGYEFQIQNAGSVDNGYNIQTILGGILVVAGTIFRIYAIEVLGKYFTTTVQIKKDHKIIEAGPYKYLRHPSYTGAYLAMLGSAMFLNSTAGIIISGLGMLIVYHLRITAEEKALSSRFKNEYAIYSKRTWKMIPLVY